MIEYNIIKGNRIIRKFVTEWHISENHRACPVDERVNYVELRTRRLLAREFMRVNVDLRKLGISRVRVAFLKKD